LQATSYKLQATSYKLQATSYKLQATSYKLQATSYKLQATSYKLRGLDRERPKSSQNIGISTKLLWERSFDREPRLRGNRPEGDQESQDSTSSRKNGG
ncbi:hypothetical protein, partial [Alcanivorax jadensis]|uniref:hypothetical protein n=1 Tax=Alcanivorax jadensis TaxID=64988 RepID=UPI0035661F95